MSVKHEPLSRNPTLLKWIDECASLTKPDRIVWCDGSEAEKKRFAAIEERLSALSSQFADHLLDATQAWQQPLAEADRLAATQA